VTYECSVVSVRGGPLRTADGVELVTDSVRSLSRKPIDTLIIPGAFAVDDVTRDRAMVQWVRRRAASCRRVCSVRVGSFLLAAAGLLDGRRAATRWMPAPSLGHASPHNVLMPSGTVAEHSPCALDQDSRSSSAPSSGVISPPPLHEGASETPFEGADLISRGVWFSMDRSGP
jgi:hypothetical protein